MAPAPAAGWMVRPKTKGLTIPQAPHQPRDRPSSYHHENDLLSLSKGKDGPRPQPPAWVAQGQFKRRCGRPVRPSPRDLARSLAAGSVRDYADHRRACAPVRAQTLRPQGIRGKNNLDRSIDVPGKKVYN